MEKLKVIRCEPMAPRPGELLLDDPRYEVCLHLSRELTPFEAHYREMTREPALKVLQGSNIELRLQSLIMLNTTIENVRFNAQRIKQALELVERNGASRSQAAEEEHRRRLGMTESISWG